MFSIHGNTDLPEIELDHLEGYRGSRPVRIGNGAAHHKQLDIYGELMDAIYLYNKYGKPTSYDEWLTIRQLIDYVCTVWSEKDMSIWEVRGEMQNFTYSKIMLWVAIDRALRLADKRCFPCPQRLHWLSIRDTIMEEVMEKGYNRELGSFIQSYERPQALDAAVLIAPLVFFTAPNDPRFLGTLDRILRPPEKGGLTSAGMVLRYNTDLSHDGVGGPEGAFSMCKSHHRQLAYLDKLTSMVRYILAHRSLDSRRCLLATTPRESRDNVGEHFRFRQPLVDVLRRDLKDWRAIGQHAASIQPPGPGQRSLQLGPSDEISTS